MRRRRMAAAAASAVLVAGMGIAATSPASAGGKSGNAKACQKSGWESLFQADGSTFADQAACVSYAAKGGTLLTEPPPACETYDATLDSMTIYAIAWTELDGRSGYTGCDQFINAAVEASGDSIPGAGDHVLFGKYPTAFTAPYDFRDFPLSSLTISSYNCTAAGAVVELQGEAPDNTGIVWSPVSGSATREVNDVESSGDVRLNAAFIDGVTPGDTTSLISVRDDNSTTELSGASEWNDPFLEVAVNTSCGSAA